MTARKADAKERKGWFRGATEPWGAGLRMEGEKNFAEYLLARCARKTAWGRAWGRALGSAEMRVHEGIFCCRRSGCGAGDAARLCADRAARGSTLSGTVRDTTQALVPGATVVLDGRRQVVSRSDGGFEFGCVD
jgi:hypothetical protein